MIRIASVLLVLFALVPSTAVRAEKPGANDAADGSEAGARASEACAGPLEGGIAQVVRDGAKSRLILNKGSKDCVKLGQSGSVAGIDELFTIVEVFPFRSIAVIDRASKTIPANGRVTIDRGAATGSDGVNPPAEACAGPLEGGIILVIPEGAKSKLILNRGSSGCVKPGQTGRIAGVDGIFTITEVHAWRAIAVIDADSKTLPAHGRVTIDRGPATP